MSTLPEFRIKTVDGLSWIYKTDESIDQEDEAVMLCGHNALPVSPPGLSEEQPSWKINGRHIVGWMRE